MSAPRAPWGLWLAALVALLVFTSAGIWQWSRGAEKLAQLDEQAGLLETRRAVALAEADAGPDALDWAAGRGRFAELPPVWLDNQQRGGRVGVRVYRVFLPDPPARALLLDLGWLPLPADRSLPALPALPEGPVEVSGLLAPPPSSGLAMGAAAEVRADGSLLAIRLDPDAAAQALAVDGGLAARVLRLDPDLPIGFERDLDVLSNTLTPEKHRGYAVQWFGLAAATLVLTVALSWRRRRR